MNLPEFLKLLQKLDDEGEFDGDDVMANYKAEQVDSDDDGHWVAYADGITVEALDLQDGTRRWVAYPSTQRSIGEIASTILQNS